MKRVLLICAAALALVGCAADPERVIQSSNPQLKVDVVGKADGCTIYRFSDDGHTHYFVRCAGSPEVASMQRQTCGKNCSYEESIKTDAVR